MQLKVACACGQSFRAPVKYAGKQVKCPKCGQPVRVPSADAPVKSDPASEFGGLDDDFSDLEPTPARRPSGGPPRVSGGKRPAATKKSAAKKKSAPSQSGLGTGTIVALAVGGVAMVGLLVAGGIYLASGSGNEAGSGGDGEATAAVVRSGTRTQKEFSSGTGSPKTTSEWLAHVKEMRSTDNPNKRILMKVSAESPENFLGADPAAFPVVLDALADPHLRDIAAEVLPKFESADKPYLDDLIAGLKHPHFEAQVWCVRLLKVYGPAAAETIPQVAELAQSPNQQLATMAAKTLGSLGPSALDAISKLLDRAEVRVTAALSAVELGPAAAPLVPKLVAALEGDDRSYRAAALKALAGIGPASEPALPALEKLLTADPGGGANSQLPLVQGVYVAIGEPAVGALQPLIEQGSAEVRAASLQTLSQLGPRAAPVLAQVVKHADPEVRLQCVQSIAANSPHAEFVPALLSAIDDADNRIVQASLHALTSFGPTANVAAGPLLERIRGKQTFDAPLLARTLAAIVPGAKLSATDLIDLLRLGTKGANVSLALYAAQQLQTTAADPQAVIPALEETAALVPTAIKALEDAKAVEQQYVVLNFTSRSGFATEIKWRPITADDIANTPNLVFLSREETITRQEINGYTFDGESAPDTSGLDSQIGEWKSLESAIAAALAQVKSNAK